MRRTTISHFSFLVPARLSIVIKGRPSHRLTLNLFSHDKKPAPPKSASFLIYAISCFL